MEKIFVQTILALTEVSQLEKNILLLLLLEKNLQTDCTNKYLQKSLGNPSLRTLQNAITHLCESGFLSKEIRNNSYRVLSITPKLRDLIYCQMKDTTCTPYANSAPPTQVNNITYNTQACACNNNTTNLLTNLELINNNLENKTEPTEPLISEPNFDEIIKEAEKLQEKYPDQMTVSASYRFAYRFYNKLFIKRKYTAEKDWRITFFNWYFGEIDRKDKVQRENPFLYKTKQQATTKDYINISEMEDLY